VFVGEYDRSVDGNGRLALPSAFRDLLGDKCYLRCDPDGFVSITTMEHFEREAGELTERVRQGEQPRSALRAFGVQSSVVSIDKQGRITLDEESRRHAGIKPGGQAVIAGAVTSLEVWRPSRYARISSEHDVVQPPRVWVDEDDDEGATG
jgi:MraZ protein